MAKRKFGQLGGSFDPREDDARKKKEEEEERKRLAAQQAQEQAYHNYVRATSALGVDRSALTRKQEEQAAYNKALDEAVSRVARWNADHDVMTYTQSRNPRQDNWELSGTEGNELAAYSRYEKWRKQQEQARHEAMQSLIDSAVKHQADKLQGKTKTRTAEDFNFAEASQQQRKAEAYAATRPQQTIQAAPTTEINEWSSVDDLLKWNEEQQKTRVSAEQKEKEKADYSKWRDERDALIDRYVNAYERAEDQMKNESRAATPDSYLDAMQEWQDASKAVDAAGGIENLRELQLEDAEKDRVYKAKLAGMDLDRMTFWDKAATALGGTLTGALKQYGASWLGQYQNAQSGNILNHVESDIDDALRLAAKQYLGSVSASSGRGSDYTQSLRDNIYKTAEAVGGADYAQRVMDYIDDQATKADPLMGFDLSTVKRNEDDTYKKLFALTQSGTGESILDIEKAFELQDSANADLQRAKNAMGELGGLGDFVVDAGSSAIQSGLDALVTKALGLNNMGAVSMLPFGARAAGGAYLEGARSVMNRGEEIGKEMAENLNRYAGQSGAIEMATELLWGSVGAMSKVTGGGALDEVTTKKLTGALQRMAKTETGAKILGSLGEKVIGGAFEGTEEVLSDALNWMLDTAGIIGEDRGTFGDMLKDAGKSFITGAMSGLFGEVTGAVAGRMQTAQIGRSIRSELKAGDTGTLDSIAAAATQYKGDLQDTFDKIVDKRDVFLDDGSISFADQADKLTNTDLGKLYEAYDEQVFGDDYGDIDRALKRLENGKDLTERDVARIVRNEAVTDYLAEQSGVEISEKSKSADAIEALKALASQREAFQAESGTNTNAEEETQQKALKDRLNERKWTLAEDENGEKRAVPYYDAERIGTAMQESAEKFTSVGEAFDRLGISRESSNDMIAAYNPGQNAVEYAGEMTRFYNQGVEGRELDTDTIAETTTITPAQARIAYTAGRAEYNTNVEEGYGTETEADGLRVRDGVQGENGQSPVGQSAGVEKASGSAEFREEIAGFRGGRQVKGVFSEPVSAADLGIAGGSQSKSIRVITESNDEHFQESKKIAESAGCKFVGFVDGSLVVDNVASRGFYDPATNTIYARMDHAVIIGEQIAKHEVMHHMIRKGQVNLSSVKEAMIKDMGMDKALDMIASYAALYEGLGMSEEKIFAELVCDSYGNMNEFVYRGHGEDAVKYAEGFKAAKKAAESVRTEGKDNVENASNEPRYSMDVQQDYYDWIDRIEEMSDEEALEINSQREYPYIEISKHTPERLLQAGADNLQMLIRFDALYLAERRSGVLDGHYHALGKDVLKNISEYLDDPDLILQITGNNGNIRLQEITRIPSKTGEVLVSVEINTVRRLGSDYNRYNVVVTVFDIKRGYFVNNLFGKQNPTIKYQKENLSQVNAQLYEWLGIAIEKSSEKKLTQPDADVKQKLDERSNPENTSQTGERSRESADSWDDMTEEQQQTEINATMTMAQAKTMVEKAFTAGGIREWYDGKYKTGDEWLRGEGSAEVAEYIENEYELQRKYINGNPHLVEYDYTIEDVLDAYLAGTLTGKAKAQMTRLDTSVSRGYQDSRFYAPNFGKANAETWAKANERLSEKNRQEVLEARKEILLAAHSGNLEQVLGISSSELNKKLRSWSNYPTAAKNVSMRINQGVAPECQWTGIQNSSILNGMSITVDDIRSMVKDVSGDGSEYQLRYIGNAMLALDTHIDWSWLSYDFKRGAADENRRSVRGLYDNSRKLITVGGSSGQNTVSHEMGHALDYQWCRELFGEQRGRNPLSETSLVESLIVDDDGRTFYHNFRAFIDDLTDSSDNYSKYTMEPTEVFARFVAKFVEWTQETAGAYSFKETIGFNDKFSSRQYMAFAKLLQEKAAWDAKREMQNEGSRQTNTDSEQVPDETSRGEDIRYSRELPHGEKASAKITREMSEEERYEALKDKSIVIKAKVDRAGFEAAEQRIGESAESAGELTRSERKELFKKLGEEFGVFKTYRNEDVYLDFEFTRRKLKESLSKQDGNYSDFGKLLSCFEDVIESAIGIEVHNRNEEGYKVDPTLSKVYVLVSAFEDGERIVPVKLEVKEFTDKENSLHVAITLEGINKSEVVTQGINGEYSEVAQSARSLDIKLADLFKKVNKKDTDFLKYVPKQFLEEDHDMGGKSSRETTDTSLYDANRQLRKDLSELRAKLKTRTEQKDYWKGQTKTTEGRRARLDDAKKLARTLAKENGSKIDVDVVGAKLKDLADFCLNEREFDDAFYEEARMRTYEIAHMILDDSEILRDEGDPASYSKLRDYLRTTKLYVPASMQHDLAEDYQAYRKSLAGTVTLTTSDTSATGIDVAYKELQEIFGKGLFPDINHPADQFKRIMEILESFKPVYERMNSYEMADAVEWTANDILGRVVGEEIRQTDPTYADKMEARLKAEREKGREALKQVRAKRDQQVQALKDHYRQVAEDKRAKRIDSEARTKLLKIARRLNSKKLDRVTRALLDQYIGDLDLVAKGITGQTVSNLRALQDWYLEQKENDPDFISDPGIEKMLQRLSKKHIKDMTQEEVADLTTILLNIENEVRTERHLIESEEKRDIYAAGMEVIDDVRGSRGKSSLWDKFIVTETLSPVREIRKLTGYHDNDPLYTATKELANGQRMMLDYQRRAEALFKKWTEDKAFTKRIAGKNAEEITVLGLVDGVVKEVKITPAMRMALYLHSKNDDNLRHISKGGVKIPDMALYKKGKMQEAYDQGTRVIFTPSALREIASHMEEDERAFADAVSRYYNGMSRDSINDVSELLKGYSIAGVEGYYPIDTDGSFLKKEFDAIKRDGSIEGMGILKERLTGASNPIMLYDMNDTLNKSISQHSKYVGLAIPVRNFNKLFSVTALGYETSVAETIRKNWAEQSVKYIEKMMADIQNGTGLDRDVWGTALAKARSKYAGAVLTTNASVAFKQTASFPTAAAVVGYGPLVRALKDSNRKVDLDKVAELTPLLWYRMKGYSNTELGDIGKEGGHIPKALNWIQGMDTWTTRKLWLAAEYYVEENNKDLNRGTEAYDQAVAEIYNRIIEETQPNYTMMQRPQILRSESDLTRALNMFKTQPFQNFNILHDAIGNYNAKKAQNDGSADALQAVKDARKGLARAISSQVVSAFVFSLMQFAWDAFRGKTKKYKDDDEEEMTLLSWLKGMGINVLSSVGGMIPFGGYALELGESMVDGIAKALGGSAVFDQTFYGMSENAAESVNDMGKALLSITSQVTELLAGDNLDESAIRKLVDSGSDIAQFAGIPVSNWIKLAQATAQNVFKVTDGEYLGGYKALRVTTDPGKYSSDYYDLLYKAYKNDKEAYGKIYAEMEKIFDPDKIKTAMENRMKKEQGVGSATDLESRWMNPTQQSVYDTGLNDITQSALWSQATDEQQQKALTALYNIALGNSAGQKLEEKIQGGASVGIDQTDYLLFQTALQMSDADGNGSYKMGETEDALRKMTWLTDAERAYLFSVQHPTAKSNPFEITRGGSMTPELAPTSNAPAWYHPKPEHEPSGQAGDVVKYGEGINENPYMLSQRGIPTQARMEFEQTPGADVYRKLWSLAVEQGRTFDVYDSLEYIASDRQDQLYDRKWEVPHDDGSVHWYESGAPAERLTEALWAFAEIEDDPKKKKDLELLYEMLADGVENGDLYDKNSPFNKLLWKLGF